MGAIATSAAGWRTLILIYAVPLCVLALGRFVFVKENPSIDAGQQHVKVTLKDFWAVFTKNKYVWFYAGMILLFNTVTNMSAQVYYFTYIVGNTDLMGILSIMGIMLLPLMLLMPLLLKKFSVSQVIMGGTVLAMVGYAINFVAGSSGAMLMIAGVLMVCMSLPLSYLCAVLLMDLFNYNEYKGLARLEGTTNQLAHGISSQLGQGMGGFLLGVFLDLGGFIAATDGAAVIQPDSAITMVRMLYSVIPIVILVGLLVCVFFLSKLDKEHFCSGEYYVAHTKDLVHWQVEGPSFRAADAPWRGKSQAHSSVFGVKSFDELPQYIRDFLPKSARQFPIEEIVRAIEENAGKNLPNETLLYAPDAAQKTEKPTYTSVCPMIRRG